MILYLKECLVELHGSALLVSGLRDHIGFLFLVLLFCSEGPPGYAYMSIYMCVNLSVMSSSLRPCEL